MGTEGRKPAVEAAQLQGVDHAAGGVEQSPGQQPAEGTGRQRPQELGKGQQTDPAHGDVDH